MNKLNLSIIRRKAMFFNFVTNLPIWHLRLRKEATTDTWGKESQVTEVGAFS